LSCADPGARAAVLHYRAGLVVLFFADHWNSIHPAGWIVKRKENGAKSFWPSGILDDKTAAQKRFDTPAIRCYTLNAGQNGPAALVDPRRATIKKGVRK
jgi:hypothetical protein